jgi:hypothetical protein
VSHVVPERELVRRVLPFFPIAAAVAFAIGALVSGRDQGLSALIAVVVVGANFVANALSMAWAAQTSPIAIYAVGLGGFVARLIVFAAAMLVLTQFHWFSARAFVITFLPVTMILLAFEMKILSSRRLQSDLWYFREGHA